MGFGKLTLSERSDSKGFSREKFMKHYTLVIVLFCTSQALPQDKSDSRPGQTEVIVTAQRKDQTIFDTTQAVEVIDSKRIRQLPHENIPDLLRNIGGLYTFSPNLTGHDATIDIRGFNNGSGQGSRTLLIVDGIRYNAPSTGNIDWNLVPSFLIDKIEVIRGPAVGLYGDNATAGVIKITTKRIESNAANIEISAGTYDTQNAGAGVPLYYRKDIPGAPSNTALGIYGFKEQTDGYRKNSEYSSDNIWLRFLYGVDWNIDIKAGGHRDSKERPGTLSRDDMKKLGRQAVDPRAPNDNGQSEEAFVLASVSRKWDWGTLQITTGSRYLKNDSFSTFLSAFGSSTTDIDELTKHTELGANVRLAESKAGSIAFGIDTFIESTDALTIGGGTFGASKTNVSLDRKTYALWANDDFRIVGTQERGLTLSAGIRHEGSSFDMERDQIEGFGFDASREKSNNPNAYYGGLNFRYDTFNIGLSSGTSYRIPNIYERFNFITNTIDLSIRPEIARTNQIVINKSHSFGGYTVLGQVTVYDTTVFDEIFFDNTNFVTTNLDKTQHKGIEESITLSDDKLFVYLSYNSVNAKVKEDPVFNEKRFPLTPPFVARGEVAYSFTPEFSVSYDLFSFSSRTLINDTLNQRERLEGYRVHNVKLTYKTGKMYYSLSVLNLFDTDYFESAGVGSDEFFNPVVRFYPAPERTFMFSFKAEL